MRLSFNRYNHEREVTIQPSMMFEFLPWKSSFVKSSYPQKFQRKIPAVSPFSEKSASLATLLWNKVMGVK